MSEKIKVLINYLAVCDGLLSRGYIGQLSHEAEEAMTAIDDEF